MELTILVDNNTLIDKYFYGEPAVSFFITDENKNILFDVGYSDAFILNAQKLQINLLQLDYLLLSHSHLDHTWGLESLLKIYMEADVGKIIHSLPTAVFHPDTFLFRPRSWLGGSGPLINEERLARFFTVRKTKAPIWLTKKLVWLGEIPRLNNFECKKPYKKVFKDKVEKDDFVIDESALAYKAKEGVVIISACSHAGICNTIEYAKKICDDDRVLDVIGGFHLLNPDRSILDETISFFVKARPKNIHPCHCTDFKSKLSLAKVTNLQEVGVGLKLSFN